MLTLRYFYSEYLPHNKHAYHACISMKGLKNILSYAFYTMSLLYAKGVGTLGVAPVGCPQSAYNVGHKKG